MLLRQRGAPVARDRRPTPFGSRAQPWSGSRGRRPPWGAGQRPALGGLRSPQATSLAARGGSLPSPKRAEPARLLRCSSVKYAEYSPSSRLAAGPAAPISARSDFHLGLLAGRLQTVLLQQRLHAGPPPAEGLEHLRRRAAAAQGQHRVSESSAGGGQRC